MEDTDLEYVLYRVKLLNGMNNPRRLPTHRNIWSGSYDVWHCEQDRIDAKEKPQAAMKRALDAEYIVSEDVQVGKYTNTIYRLTPIGEEHLRQCDLERIAK